MVNPVVTPQLMIEEWAAEIRTLVTAGAHLGMHNEGLHLAANAVQTPGLLNCPRCRLTLVAAHLAEMVSTLDDTIVLPHLGTSNRDAAFERLKAIRENERVPQNGPP